VADGAIENGETGERIHHFVSVVLPAYDEAENLAANLRRLVGYVATRCDRFEIVVTDDGSRDDTHGVAREEAARDPRIRVLRHERNRGKGAALATGCRAARGDVLVLLDADLEIPPEEVPPLLRRMDEAKADVAVGTKYHAGARRRWPWHRRLLSRAYRLVTGLLFRLPLRDTQTGLKAIRRDVALDLVPRLRSQRFAWDVELLLLAHRSGRRCVAAPVELGPSLRASRVTLRNALLSGLDTLRIFLRDRGLAAYGALGRRRPPRPARTRVIVSGDDLGLSRSTNEGLLLGLERGGLTSVGVLADAPHAAEGLAALRRRIPGADVGLHADALRGGSLARAVLASLLGTLRPSPVAADLSRQLDALRAQGVVPTHLDAHRHFWLTPGLRRAACAAAAAAGVRVVRSLRPAGPFVTAGPIEALKRGILWAASIPTAGLARAYGLASPDGHVDARSAAAWVRRGRVPAWARGRTLEVIAHPTSGPDDLPASERRTLDRAGETRAVLEPALSVALAGLGVSVIRFDDLVRERRPATNGRAR
jgi:hypothetical protein